jgi:hypothetical protein
VSDRTEQEVGDESERGTALATLLGTIGLSSRTKSGSVVRAAVIALLSGELYSETNDNSVAILLTYGTARGLLADDAEARKCTWPEVCTRGLKRWLTFETTKSAELRFRARLTEGASKLTLI